MASKETVVVIMLMMMMMGTMGDQRPYHPPPPPYQPDPYSPPAPHQDPYKPKGMPHRFEYKVKDDYAGTDFGQNEESDGNTVKGSYTVQLPDGRKQTVNYEADHYKGFQADVQYYGEAQYPHEYGPPVTFKPQSFHQPSYQPPQLSYQPQPSYQPQEPSYSPQEPSYPPPEPSYPPPEPSYN